MFVEKKWNFMYESEYQFQDEDIHRLFQVYYFYDVYFWYKLCQVNKYIKATNDSLSNIYFFLVLSWYYLYQILTMLQLFSARKFLSFHFISEIVLF